MCVCVWEGMYMDVQCLGGPRQSYRGLWSTPCGLQMELRSSGRTVHGLNHWTISPAHLSCSLLSHLTDISQAPAIASPCDRRFGKEGNKWAKGLISREFKYVFLIQFINFYCLVINVTCIVITVILGTVPGFLHIKHISTTKLHVLSALYSVVLFVCLRFINLGGLV